ncbi:MAG: leucine-rich repeat domain-containing protein, partial [Clostridia bacterium]|nr:leucine-rich repeat domain-containing protein [Clostridia bacterium]
MRNKFTLFTVIVAIICTFTFSACDNSSKKTDSEELEFALYNYSREYQVTGIGTFSGDKVSVPATYKGKNVTSVGENAFSGSGITEITLPDTVTEICAGAFSDCFALTKIVIPDGIKTVKEKAFNGADALNYMSFGGGEYLGNADNPHLLLVKSSEADAKEITVHQNTKIIGNAAFYDYDGISDLIIPDAIEKVEDYAFYGCDNLVSVTLGSGLKEIEDHAFLDCNKIVEVFDHSSLNVKKGQRSTTGYVAYNALKVYSGDAESKIVTDNNGFKIFNDGNEKVLVGYDGTESEIT